MKKNSNYKKMFKIATAAAVTASAVAVVAPTADAATTFSDVTDKNVHATNINALASQGIVKGFTDGTFKPYASVNRGQAAKIIAGLLGLETDPAKVTDPGFKDLKPTNEYYGAIAALVKVGAISGFQDNTYGTYQPITRVQMAKIISVAFGLTDYSVATPFTDVTAASIGDNVKYVNALYAAKVTTGTTATTFGPRANVTRGQIASFVIRAKEAKKVTPSYPSTPSSPTPESVVDDVLVEVGKTITDKINTPAFSNVKNYIKAVDFNSSSNTLTVKLNDAGTDSTLLATIRTELQTLVQQQGYSLEKAIAEIAGTDNAASDTYKNTLFNLLTSTINVDVENFDEVTPATNVLNINGKKVSEYLSYDIATNKFNFLGKSFESATSVDADKVLAAKSIVDFGSLKAAVNDSTKGLDTVVKLGTTYTLNVNFIVE